MLRDFKTFLLRGNVVDLAVAVVMGAAFGAIVTALVRDLLTPIVAVIFGKPTSAACPSRSTAATSCTATSSTTWSPSCRSPSPSSSSSSSPSMP
jgi:large-conductance mechanosensitive channel